MRTRLALALAILFLGGCRASSGSLTVTPSGSLVSSSKTQSTSASVTKTGIGASPTTAKPASSSPAPGTLAPFHLDLSQPFYNATLTEWTPGTYRGTGYTLPLSQSSVANPQVVNGLTNAERAYLWQNGFVIIHSQEDQFAAIRHSVDSGQPYFLTVDAAYHALHQNFDDLLKELERGFLRPRMQTVLQATLDELHAHSGEWQGTPLEKDGSLSIAYLDVAMKLFDPEFEADPSIRELVDSQIALILAAGGWGNSPIAPEFADDYGAYKPVGHYAGDPELENYFRGMTWLGRMHFSFENKSRLPLVVTLALRRAQLDGSSASLAWGEIYRVLDFIVGPSDDAGPLEYSALMDQVYGSQQTFTMLADESLLEDFYSRGDQLPAPQINSTLVQSTRDLSSEKGWRFMGQRFTVDAFVFQNLISDRVPRRQLPTGLDVMTVFGSSAARSTLTEFKMDQYTSYDSQLAALLQGVQAQPEAEWTNRFYTAWLYSFFPILGAKGAAFPPFMNTPAWGYKEMNSGLGSWAELKHDTVLYTKMPEGRGGGGPPGSGPAPAYVEPNPNAFYRMAYAARTLARGLLSMKAVERSESMLLDFQLQHMVDLGDLFENLGDAAVKEINGEPIDDYGNIWSCLGWVECSTLKSDSNPDDGDPPEVPVVAAVAGYTDDTTSIVLEVGVGFVDRIFVVVPLEGELQIAQGGVFSYYEFSQPRDNRLTDQEWRDKLISAAPPALPAWASKFVLKGGKPTPWTVFRIDDVYLVTEAGDKVNVRETPTISAGVLFQLPTDEYITIIDGPVQADGYTWWKIDAFSDDRKGWVVENQAWYERV